VTVPHASRHSRNMQFSFINGRFVKNKTVIAAAENAYKGTVMVGKFPGYILNINMPYDAVDVNVHPAKTEVRFANDGEMFSTVYRAVKMAISGDLPLKQFTFKQKTVFDIEDNNVKQQTLTDVPSEKSDKKVEYSTFSLPLSFEKQEKTDKYINKYIIPQFETGSGQDFLASENVMVYEKSAKNNISDLAQETEENIVSQNDCTSNNEKAESDDILFSEDSEEENITVIGEIFSTYILCSYADELIVIDKHAAHERLLYERLKRNMKRGKQMLLVPATVKLTAAEKNAVLENMQLLEEQGFEIEEFGTAGVIVRAIPMYITSEDPAALVSEIAYNLAEGNKAEFSEKIDWIFHSVACRSAIKAGNKAEINQLTRLVKDIRKEKIPLYCPHGRPVIISITKKELEKQFGR